MTDFTGKLISNTYKQLLKVAVSTNDGLDSTVRVIESGDGTDSPLQLSDDTLNINGTFQLLGVAVTVNANQLNLAGQGIFTKVSASSGTFLGAVSANTYYGDGSNLTGVIASAETATNVSGGYAVLTSAQISSNMSVTDFVADTGSFTTKVSGVAGEFSGTVSAATFDGALTGNVTGDIDGASGSFSTGISTTDLVAVTGSFTTKVSGVAGEFSGTVSAGYFTGDGSNLTNLPSASTSVASFTVNQLTVVTVASIASLNVDTNILLKAQGDLRFGDADSSNYVAFQGDGTIASNITWTLPNADGDENQSLITDGSGALSWATGGGGYFKGDNGTVGSSAGDIFRINELALDADVTITATENASATGPLSVAAGVTLQVDGTLVII
tara:strand:- start:435 stop:1589 length:1155 start_codon:yes stop_codon:yes gene_type:complete